MSKIYRPPEARGQRPEARGQQTARKYSLDHAMISQLIDQESSFGHADQSKSKGILADHLEENGLSSVANRLRNNEPLYKATIGPDYFEHQTGRRRQRIFSNSQIIHAASRLGAKALSTGKVQVSRSHAGGVANAYGYPAVTDIYVMMAHPDGRVIVNAGQSRAQYPTFPSFGRMWELFDNRIGENRKKEARNSLLEWLDEYFKLHGHYLKVDPHPDLDQASKDFVAGGNNSLHKISKVELEGEPTRMSRAYAAKAPAGGIIVREGFRAQDPSATYHGGIAYPGGKFIPRVNSPKKKRPKVRVWKPRQVSGELSGVSGKRQMQRPRRYAAFDPDVSRRFADQVRSSNSPDDLMKWADWLEENGHPTVATVLRKHLEPDSYAGRPNIKHSAGTVSFTNHNNKIGFVFFHRYFDSPPKSKKTRFIIGVEHPITTDHDADFRAAVTDGDPDRQSQGSWYFSPKNADEFVEFRNRLRAEGIREMNDEGHIIGHYRNPYDADENNRHDQMSAKGKPRRYAAFDPDVSHQFHEALTNPESHSDQTKPIFHQWMDWTEESGHPTVANLLREAVTGGHDYSYGHEDHVEGDHPHKMGWSYYPNYADDTISVFHRNKHGDHLSWRWISGGKDNSAKAQVALDDEGVTRLTTKPTTKSSMEIFRRMTPAERQYIDTALWSTNDEQDPDGGGGEPMDANHGITDVHPHSLQAMLHDLHSFIQSNAHHLEGVDTRNLPSHFWLSQQRHGTGIWDHSDIYGDATHDLNESAHGYSEDGLYIGDDGMIHSPAAHGAYILRYPEPKELKAHQMQRRRYARPDTAHHLVGAIVKTRRWEPFLALADHANATGRHALATLLRAYHIQSTAEPQHAAFGKPHGYNSDWAYHPPGFSFSLYDKPKPYGDEGMIKIRHSLPGSTTAARMWDIAMHPNDARWFAQQLRSEGGIHEFIRQRTSDGGSANLWYDHGNKRATPARETAPVAVASPHDATGSWPKQKEGEPTHKMLRKGRIYRPSETVIRMLATAKKRRYMHAITHPDAQPFLEEIARLRWDEQSGSSPAFDRSLAENQDKTKSSEHKLADFLEEQGDPAHHIVRAHANGYRVPSNLHTAWVGNTAENNSGTGIGHAAGTGVFSIFVPFAKVESGSSFDRNRLGFHGKLSGQPLIDFVRSLPEDIQQKLVLPKGRSKTPQKSVAWRELEAAGFKVHRGWQGRYFHATAPNGDSGRVFKQHGRAWHWYWENGGTASGDQPSSMMNGGIGDVLDNNRNTAQYERLIGEAPVEWYRRYPHG